MQSDGLLSMQDVARLLNVSVATLKRWRHDRVGPHSFKVGVGRGQIRYRLENVQKWLQEQERKEAEAGQVQIVS